MRGTLRDVPGSFRLDGAAVFVFPVEIATTI
jgi:hypothetical protein